tara:strand:+ start:1927 stop:3012 length:1086 start_codon:yes stop_codon:yes gene_type:complete
MISNNSINKKFFEDRTGTSVRPGVIFDSATGKYIVNTLYTSGVNSSVSTPATARLGNVNSSADDFTAKQLENVGYPDNKNIGSVTVFLNEQHNAKDLIDFHRKGKNIRNIEHYSRACTTLPLLRVSVDNFFEDETLGNIDYRMNLNTYGQGYVYLDIDESLFNQKLIPFDDFSKVIPAAILGTTTGTGYPIIHNNRKNYNQFVDPSDEKINGAIDVFSVRRSLIDNAISDIKIKGIKSHLQAGGLDTSEKGSYLIQSVKEQNSFSDTDFFEDAQDIIMTKALPGYIALKNYRSFHFVDSQKREESSAYTFLSSNQKETLLAKSDNNRSAIGTRFKSSTNGLIFGESNVMGTDSIAFGGLKK